MTDLQVMNVIFQTVEEMRPNFIPNPETRGKTSTGNMAFNSLRAYVGSQGGNLCVYIEMNENIAPYVVYTDKPWISPKWGGKKNPNEGWWERFLEELMRRLAQKLNGELTFYGGAND